MRRFLRGAMFYCLGLAIGAGLAWGVDSASSAPPLPVLAERSHQVVEDLTGTRLVRRPFSVGDQQMMQACGGQRVVPGSYGCDGLAYSDRILLSPDVWWAIQQTWDRPGLPFEDAAKTILHEQLHRPGLRPGPLDEGIVEAYSVDLAPAWSRRVFGQVMQPGYEYLPQVRAIRTASARIAHSGWRTRKARLVRRALWMAPDDTRERMVRAALSPLEYRAAFESEGEAF